MMGGLGKSLEILRWFSILCQCLTILALNSSFLMCGVYLVMKTSGMDSFSSIAGFDAV